MSIYSLSEPGFLALWGPRHVWYERPRILKNGKRGKSWAHWHRAPYSAVRSCDDCGRLSSTRWVRQWWINKTWRSRTEIQRDGPSDPEPTLCMGCMNRWRVLWNVEMLARENRYLIRKLTEEIRRGKED